MGRDRYSIGEFSRRSGLTARALRLYDDAGLLKPAAVDPTTGYRSYRSAQLGRAQLIAMLRAAGVPLSTVKAVVDANPAIAHSIVDRWWTRLHADHLTTAALVPRIHELLDGRTPAMTDEASPAADTTRWERALHAVIRGDAESLERELAGSRALADERGPDGSTLLLHAARACGDDHAHPGEDSGDARHTVVVRLLEAGADPSAPDAEGWTPLHSAGLNGPERLARILLDAGARTDAMHQGRAGSTPLSYALFYGRAATAEAIAGDAPDPDDLRTAAALGDLDRLHRWLDGGRPLPDGAAAGMDFFGPPQWFPPRADEIDDQLVLDEALSWAARSERLDAMSLLVAHGADVNRSPFRGTPLLWAAGYDRVRSVEWLLDHGADPDLRHDFGGEGHGVQAVAMHLAAQYGALQSLQLLLDRGADATIVDGLHGGAALGWARFGEQPEAVALLERHLGVA